MKDVIYRQAAIDAVYKSSGIGTALKALKALPPAQSEIIRCGDCKYNNNCDIQFHAQAGDTFYCGASKRKTNGFN